MYLGIDLGTSNSAIAGNDGRELRVFKTTDGYDVLPSALMMDRRGAMFVGKRAYEQEAFSPENVAKRFKRLMGTSSPVTFKGANRSMTPEEASSEVLKALLAQARMDAQTGTDAFETQGAIVTIPAAFNQMQSEATMRAAGLAGIDSVGLLQEPIAAAMASLAERGRAGAPLVDGQFLVYDLGGGTFDAAIVQSIGGTVNIVGHAGVNMLGGTDFDRALVNALVRPWLLEKFDLPEDLQNDPAYARVLRIAAFYAEKAKIEVSAQPTSTIFADEQQIATRDRAGQDIYLDIPLSRSQVETLVADHVDRSIDVCRKLVEDSGYASSDIDRIVFIGGPTRMPIIRSRVPDGLGIAADLATDPMTAVAIGAAIFAESRDWRSGAAAPKPARTSSRTDGPVEIEYSYPERTADGRIRIRVRPAADLVGKGYRIQLDSDAGWTSGQLDLDSTSSINDVPVGKRGDNRFRITVLDAMGVPVPRAETLLTVRRVDAAASGAPLTHTIAVKIIEGPLGTERNVLDDLVERGHPLPASGVKDFRAATDLRPGDAGELVFDAYQREPDVVDPQLALHIGAFRIAATDLDRDEIVRRGDHVRIHWTLDHNGLLDCELEVKGQGIGRRFKTGKMFTYQRAQQNFEGADGEALAEAALDAAQRDLAEAERTLGPKIAPESRTLAVRIDRQRLELKNAYEADTRRLIAEEARLIRHEIFKIRARPENVADTLNGEIDRYVMAFNAHVRPYVEGPAVQRFDQLTRIARETIARGNMYDAAKSLAAIREIFSVEAGRQPAFMINYFLWVVRERHRAIDKEHHERLARNGELAVERKDLAALQAVIKQMRDNQIRIDDAPGTAAALASLMKW
jgi:molecular chaperone DnaK